METLRNEPTAAVGLVQAMIALAVAFGLDLSAEQVGAIVAGVATMTAFFLRQQVTPVASLRPARPAAGAH